MLGIAAILIVLLSLTAVAFAAVPPLKSSEPAGTDGYSTYIVAFKDQQGTSSVAEDQVTSLVNSFNGRIVYKYSIINGMAVTIPDSKVDQLKAMDNVKYVEKDQQVHVLLDKAVPQIGADQVWESGYTGKGVKVAVIDTGIDGGHPDLNGNKVVGWVDYVQGKTSPYDDHGHGTHCAGTIAGTGAADNGKYKGVAPEASLMGIKVLGKDGSGSNSNILKGIDWAVQNDADVISMSLGSSTHSQASDDAIKKAVNAGVIVVVAAGNSGPNGKTIACPGDSPDAITVGAVDRNDQIASFSSRGPTYDGRTKPDVTNMGVGLVAAKATGVASSKPVGQYYQAMSGTSMATPMTSGVVALLLEAKPGMNQQQVKDALTKTAKQLGSGTPNNNYGYGRVQAQAALDYVLSGQVPAPTPTPTPTPGPSPTPTPTPGPSPTPTPTPTPGGSYAVGLISMFAQYNGQIGSMERFTVTPGTTLTQSIMIANTGSAADSYTVSVNGIPAEWYSISGYNGGTVSPQAAASMKATIKPAADAVAGAYQFTVTATSNSDSSVSSTKTYTLNVGAGRTTPTPTSVPGPNPTSTPVPTPTPVPEPGTGLTGTVGNGGDYYAYIAPAQAGQITAKIAWQGNFNDLDMYLYNPEGKLVAQSQQRYTNSESIQYSAPREGYYLLKVHAQRALQSVAFTGTATPEVTPAYKKTGSIAAGQNVAYSFTTGDVADINARLIWNWGFNSLTLSLYDQDGNKITSSTPNQNSMTAPYAQIDYPYPAPGTYTLQVDGTKVSGKASYVLISPYQL